MGDKLKATVVLVFVFGLGIAAGIAWEVHRSHHKSPRTIFGERRIAKLKKELKLNTWQEQNLRDIVQDARDRATDVNDAADYDLAQIRTDSLEEIRHLLTDEQRVQFDALRARIRAKKMRQEKSNPTPAPSQPREGPTS